MEQQPVYFISSPSVQPYAEEQPRPPSPTKQFASLIGILAGGLGGRVAGQHFGNKLKGAFGLGAPSELSTFGPPTTPNVIGAGVGSGVQAAEGASSFFPSFAPSMSSLTPLLAAPLAAATVAGSVSGAGKVLKGKPLSGVEQAALALPTFGASLLYNPISKAFGSGKDKDQLRRDSVRRQMRDAGMIDTDYNLNLADSSRYNIGIDGRSKPYNVDFSKAGAGDIVGAVDPLAEIITQNNPKLRSDFSGYFTNAVEKADPNRRGEVIKDLYSKAGLDRNTAYQSILEMQNLDDDRRNSYRAAIDRVFGVKNPNAPKQEKPKGMLAAAPTNNIDKSLALAGRPARPWLVLPEQKKK